MRRVVKWTGVVIVITILYQIRHWVSSAQRLRDPKAYETCAKDPLCRHNLQLGPVEWFHPNPDTYSYIEPTYRVLKGGPYQLDYRLPGLGIIYALGYVLGGEAGAFWILGIGGVLVWGLGQGIWAAYLERKGISPWLIGLGIALVGATPTFPHTIWGLLTEPYAGGLGLLGLYLLRKQRWTPAGLLFAWVYFLRPVLGVWLLPTTWYAWKQARWRGSLFFLAPFLLTEGAWIVRNWLVYQDFRPLSGTRTVLSLTYETGLEPAIIKLLRLTGYEFADIFRGAVPPLSDWKNIFKELENDPICTPESLYLYAKEVENLLRHSTYRNFFSRIEDPVPSQEDCEKEALLIAKIQNCAQRLRVKKPWARLSTIWVRLRKASYTPSPLSEKAHLRDTVSRIYQITLYILCFIIIIFPQFITKQGHFARMVGIISFTPILIYLGLEAVDRRYIDIQLLFGMLHLAIAKLDQKHHNIK